MADINSMELNQRTAQALISSLIQHQFASQLQQQDPLRQLQMQAAQQEIAQKQRAQSLMEEARARLLGGASGAPGAGQADNPITFGTNPRSGIASFNNLGYVGGGESALPDNQRAIAERYNRDAMRPEARPIFNENNVLTKPSTQLPARGGSGSSLEQALLDLHSAGISPAIQGVLLDRMFPELKQGKLTDEEKMAYGFMKQNEAAKFAADRADKSAQAAADRADQSAQAGFLRDLLKAHAAPVNPKAYETAQKAIAAAIGNGMSEDAVSQLAKSMGFTIASGSEPGALRSFLGMGPSSSGIVLQQTGSPLTQMLQGGASLPDAIQQIMGARGAKAPSAAPAAGADRVVVTKDGKDFSLPASQLQDALKQGYKQKK